ncbi:MAG: glycosyltransferase family 39 protein, partial [Actinomycetota bacterium]
MSTTAPGAERARGGAAPGAPRLSLVLRNRRGSEVLPATIRRLALAFRGILVEVLVADETLKIGSTELLTAARLEDLPVRVVRARDALPQAIASARGTYVAVADADERHPPEMLAEMLFDAAANDVDLVIAARRRPGSQPHRVVVSACGAAVRGLSDPLAPFFVVRAELMRSLDVRRGATILALDVLLAHPQASVSELPVSAAVRSRARSHRGVRRTVAETAHAARLLRAGAGARAHRVRARVTDRAWAVRHAAEAPWALPVMLAIVAVAGVLRFWALPSLHWYGHDEGHASMAAHRMLVEHQPVLTGQPTSRGVHLGPGYYYLVAPLYALFGMSPFAGAFLAAAAGVLAVLLVFLIGRRVFGAGAGAAAAAIMATAPIAVYFGRFGWNPNTLPFFSALFVYALLCAPANRRWLPVAAFCAALAPQLHASGLLLPGALGVWLLTRRPRTGARGWIATGAAFAVPLLPMAAAELR